MPPSIQDLPIVRTGGNRIGTAALAATACSSGAPHPASMTTVEPSVASTAVTTSRSDHSTAGAMYVRIVWRNACSCGVRAARAIFPRPISRSSPGAISRPPVAGVEAPRGGRAARRTIASAVRQRSHALGTQPSGRRRPAAIAATPTRPPSAWTSARSSGAYGRVSCAYHRSRSGSARIRAPTIAPADVPTTSDQSRAGTPASSSPRSTPSSHAMPATPPPPRTSARLTRDPRSARRPSRCPGRHRCTSSPGRSVRRSAPARGRASSPAALRSSPADARGRSRRRSD